MDALNLTTWLLLARYDGSPVVRARTVCADFFEPLTYPKFLEQVGNGRINLPVMRMYDSRKAPRYVHVSALARFLDQQHALAIALKGQA